MVTMTPAQQQQATQPQYEISEADRARVQRIANAWRAYDGDFDKPLVPMPNQFDDNVVTNRMRQIVDRGNDFLFGKELGISVGEHDPKGAQDFLDRIWGRKETRIPLLQRLFMNGAMAGNPFLRIVPSPGTDKNGQLNFRLVAVDPSTVYVRTAPQDCELVELFCIEYCNDNKDQYGHPQRIYYREEIQRMESDPETPEEEQIEEYEDIDANGIDPDVTWQIGHWTRVGDRGPWTPVGQPYVWPYPFPPLFSCQNLPRPNDPWGIPDITPDLIVVNNALNFVQSNINRVNKLYGSPFIWGKGIADTNLDVKPGRITILAPTPDSMLGSVPITSDIANALSFANDLRSDIDEQSSVPGVATGRIRDMPRGNLSGIAIELLFMPLLKKTEKKQCLYGDLIINVSKALLVLNGMSPDIDITLSWQSPLPHEDLPTAQYALALKELGVSDSTLLEELGYNPDEEQARSQAEDALKMPMLAPGMQQTPPDQQQPGQPVQAGGQQ